MTNLATQYHAGYAGRIRVPATTVPPLPLDERKIIARRAAFELPPNGIVNLGVGVPEGVASVANEEKVLQYITLSVESGAIGGIPASGASFGASLNMDAIIDENQQFDFYDGGGLDLAAWGMAECDRVGNVNVSRFGSRLIGIGGFINISQNARRVVFAGAFTAGGLEVAVEDGKLKILKEGREKKFVDKVGQISFSGQYAYDRSRPVLYVTERCVFRRVRSGLALIEVAPGIDERDILAHMDFKPIISEPDLMDPRIFRPEPMGLETHLLNLDLSDRVTYDPQRNILFLNFVGMYIRVKDDIVALRKLLEERCKQIGKRVGVFVNYDGFRISEDTYNEYAEMDRYLLEHYYTQITRFATSAFMRMKLGQAFTRRNIAPHVFENKDDAHAFLASLDAQQHQSR